jgi:Putative Ig domain/Bacterial Ig-like domain (group 1)
MKSQTRVLTLTVAAVFLSLAATLPALAQDLSSSPPSLQFGNVYIGKPSGSKVLTITNLTGSGLTIESMGFDCPGYGIASGVAPFSFGLTQTITHYSIFLNPTAAQNYNCNFIMNLSDGTSFQVPLTGTGVLSTGVANLNKSSFSFPNQKVGTTSAGQTVTISNTGSSAVTLTGITLSPPSFTTNAITLPANIAAGSTLPISVFYTPSGVEAETGALDLTYTQVIDNGITLSGNGIAPTALVVSTLPTLPQATQTAAYQTVLAASGGTGAYSWALASGSTLPSGLTLSSSGEISGTLASSVATGNYSFTVKVTDTSSHATASSLMSIGVFANLADNCNDISFDVPNTTTPITALTDLGTGTYQGSEGGLYPNGSNARPPSHDADGVTFAKGIVPLDSNGNYSPTGKYVMLAIGESTAQNEFGRFLPLANADPATNPNLVIVNGAQGGGTPFVFESTTSAYWATVLNNYLPQNNVTAKQVVVIWMEDTDGIATGTFPTDIAELQTEYETMMQTMHTLFPNLKMVYFSPRVYGGYSNGVGNPDNPEPYAYEVGFAMKWAIQDQINGAANLNYNPALGAVKAPWMSWGPYYWSNGMLGRKDGLEWDCADFSADGTHPSSTYGQLKVATALLDYMKTDDTTTPWFLAQGSLLSPNGGNDQTGAVGTKLPTPLTVLASNDGTAVSGVSVSFTDGSGGGTFSPNPAVTNSSGIASTSYTLPPTPGTYTISGSSSGYTSATFTETATAGSKTIVVNGGNNQSGVAGSTLPTALTVKATNNGTAVSGLKVSFIDNKAGGIFNPPFPVTNSSGIASTMYTLPTTAKTITITSGAIDYSTATFTETSTAAGKVITVTGGNNQTGAAGTALPTALTVKATNNGTIVSGLSVTFKDNQAGGSFNPTTAITNSSGIASTIYTLPNSAKVITVTAGSVGYTSTTFKETSTVTKTLAVNGGNNQSGPAGTKLPTALSVLAKNGSTAVSGVSVSFTDGAGGVYSPNPAITNSSGIASTSYTLPATAGTYTTTASSTGYSSATFTETATGSTTVAQLGLVSGGKQTGTVGTTLPAPIVIKAKDSSGAIVVGASISFSDGVGGKFSPNPAVTDSTGQASTSYTLPNVAQSLTVTASVGSVTTTASEKSVAGAASKNSIVTGNNQSANPNTLLPLQLVVLVTDQFNNPVSGFTVTFSDNSAGGTFSTKTPVTDSLGHATVSYTTGSKAGTVTISAGATGINSVNFTETVI